MMNEVEMVVLILNVICFGFIGIMFVIVWWMEDR